MAVNKFFRRGISKAFFVPTISSQAAPTAVEVNAGTSLTALVAELNGFSFENQPIDTPNMSETFVSKIPGEDQSADSTIVFYEQRGTDPANPLMATLAKGTAGYIVIFFGGTAGASPAATDRADVWPVISTGVPRQYDLGNEAAKWSCMFAPTAAPSINVALV